MNNNMSLNTNDVTFNINEECEKLTKIINEDAFEYKPSKISLNAFEIIIKCGININAASKTGHAPIHAFFSHPCTNHTNNILNLFIKYGTDLNVVNYYDGTVLDTITWYQNKLNEETRNCIMILIDFGVTTSNPKQNTEIYDFIEYYKYSNIKPAIKNENKI